MSDAKPSLLRPWRYARAAIGAFVLVRLGGDPLDAGNVPRFILGMMALVIAFGLLLRMERWIQTKREEAENGRPDP